MSNKGLIVIILTVAMLGAAAFAIQSNNPAPAAPIVSQVSANAPRLPAAEAPLLAVEADDYIDRHPEMLKEVQTTDHTDYFLRHSTDSTWRVGAAAATDYIERHPELLRAGNAVDLTDYAARHPELRTR